MKSRNSKFSITIGLIAIFLSACNGQLTTEPTATISPSSTLPPTTLPTATTTATATVTPTETTIPQPGTLAFASCSESKCAIYSIDNDGSVLTKLTSDMVYIFNPLWSPDSTKIVFSACPTGNIQCSDGNFDIFTISFDGSQLVNLTNNPSEDRNPDWSPDGKKIVFNSNRSGNHEIYSINADGTELKRLTNNTRDDMDPKWSPNGSRIVYETTKNLSTGGWYYEICVMNSDGTEQKELIEGVSPLWAPDGTHIAFSGADDNISDIFMIEPDGTGLKNLINNPTDEFDFSWSPDSKLIAFATNRDYNAEIYILCVDCEGNQQINITNSDTNDQKPSWSPDGTQIAFLSEDTLCVMNADGSQKMCFDIKASGTIDWKP